MIQDRRSGTAERVAMRRAAHQLWDEPVIFPDPLAWAILSDEARERIRTGIEEENGNPWARGLRAFIAVRSRFAEEEIAKAAERGVRQAVILGAGLDTFGYRNPHAELQVFEVDHPATQAWKQERLRNGEIGIPESVRFAPVDFERDTLAHGLAAAGFREDEPAFFSWLGVVPYLSREAAFGTLGFIATLPPKSGVVFDYAIPRERMSEQEQLAFDRLAERVARAGEPFRLLLDPEQLAHDLLEMGFTAVEDLDGAAIRERWFGQPRLEQRLHGRAGRLLCARV
ncbi:MAG TPA: class I SAM-dependent methyltransferase [Acidobacteriaceae bacterium]|jgi:methyltransferase (TIGR00027 family)